MKRLSHSQVEMFKGCKRRWYLKYIAKLEVPSDFTYANAGTCVHDTMQYYYEKLNADNNKIEDLKVAFDRYWKKYSMPSSFLKDKDNDYWKMVLDGVRLQIPLTSTELKIYYEDFLAYLDGVNTKTHKIYDWKTSTVSQENKEEYLRQLKRYAWMYYRKFKVLPDECVTVYLKKPKNPIVFVPTIEDIKETQKEMDTIQNEIDTALRNKSFPKCCEDMSLCNHFCAYKDYCFGSEKIDYNLEINGNYITIKTLLPPLLESHIEKKFSYEVQGAHFIRQNSKWDGVMRLYDMRQKRLGIGFLPSLKKTLIHYADHKKMSYTFNIVDNRTFDNRKIGMPDKFLNGIELRDYQNEAVDIFLKNKIGFLECCTSSGKTEMSMEIARQINGITLFVVNRKELMYQTKERFEKAFGMEIGIIGDGISKIKPITIATIQTLVKDIKKYINYFSKIRLVIFDEAHALSAKSYRILMRWLGNAEYRLSLSATAFRDDKNDMLLEEGGGQILHKLDVKTMIKKGYIMMPTIKFYRLPTILKGAGYPEDYQYSIVENDERNNIVCDVVKEHRDKKIMILVKKIEHGEALNRMIPNSFHLHGSVGKVERNEEFSKFVKGDSGVLIATISIASEGLNIPDLHMIVNASANAGDVKSIQVLGRVLRKIEGKKEALYVDFLDTGKFTQAHSRKRYNTFKEQGYEIEVVENE